MIDEKNVLNHVLSMEAAAKTMLSEASKIRAMFEVKERPAKMDMTTFKFNKRRQRSLNKKSLA